MILSTKIEFFYNSCEIFLEILIAVLTKSNENYLPYIYNIFNIPIQYLMPNFVYLHIDSTINKTMKNIDLELLSS